MSMVKAGGDYVLRGAELEVVARRLGGGAPVLGSLPRADPEWREVRRYLGTGEGGHTSRVLVARMPAMFWRVQSEEAGIDLTTGSGPRMAALAGEIASAVSVGMLGVTGREA